MEWTTENMNTGHTGRGAHEALVAAAQELAAVTGKAAGSNGAVASYGADAATSRRV